MSSALKMKVADLFSVGEKTIFAGELETAEKQITVTKCRIVVDGAEVGVIEIGGEVRSSSGYRDLWTKSDVPLTRDTVRDHDVWLIAA